MLNYDHAISAIHHAESQFAELNCRVKTRYIDWHRRHYAFAFGIYARVCKDWKNRKIVVVILEIGF